MINWMIHKSPHLAENLNPFHVGLEVSLNIWNFLIIVSISFSIESQLQLAFINQIYFNDKNPEAIFGPIQIDLVHQMVQSIESQQAEPSLLYSSSLCPPNFV